MTPYNDIDLRKFDSGDDGLSGRTKRLPEPNIDLSSIVYCGTHLQNYFTSLNQLNKCSVLLSENGNKYVDMS